MIVVKIELWPHGNESKAREIGRCNIWNDGTGTKERGNYKAELKHAGIYYGKEGNWKTGGVKDHRRNLSPYHLVYSAIKNCLWKSK